MIKDYLLIIARNFSRRKLRGWLTILGILIGVTAVVSLVSLGQGLNNYVNQEFEKMGSDKIMIMPGSGFMGAMTNAKMTEEDLNSIKNTKGVKLVGGMIYGQTIIKFKTETKTSLVIGIPQDETKEIFDSMQNFEIYRGRDIKSDDINRAVIGIALYDGDLFGEKVNLRDTITIKERDFEVVGVISKIGNPSDDSQVYISIDDARDLFDEPEDYNYLMVQVAGGVDVADVAEAIKKELRSTRDVAEGDEDFNVQTAEDLLEKSASVIGVIQAVIVAIAAISLVVGGIGIMNTMYTSVLERTREIGIMKAIGARNSDIMLIFLIESGMLGLVGGTIGAAIGMGFSKLAEWGAVQAGYGVLRVSFSPTLLLGVLAFSFIVGAISGIMPAMQASGMKPVEALRYE